VATEPGPGQVRGQVLGKHLVINLLETTNVGLQAAGRQVGKHMSNTWKIPIATVTFQQSVGVNISSDSYD
jgi:hypothetical protein